MESVNRCLHCSGRDLAYDTDFNLYRGLCGVELRKEYIYPTEDPFPLTDVVEVGVEIEEILSAVGDRLSYGERERVSGGASEMDGQCSSLERGGLDYQVVGGVCLTVSCAYI